MCPIVQMPKARKLVIDTNINSMWGKQPSHDHDEKTPIILNIGTACPSSPCSTHSTKCEPRVTCRSMIISLPITSSTRHIKRSRQRMKHIPRRRLTNISCILNSLGPRIIVIHPTINRTPLPNRRIRLLQIIYSYISRTNL